MRAVDRFFDSDPAHKRTALSLYQSISDLPLICPHGHVDAAWFADPSYRFGNPAELLITPDHYVFRMLYSQGVPLERLGIGRDDADPRVVWQTFADHFYLFRATPTGVWLRDELADVFGIDEKLDGQSASSIYDALDAQLKSAEFSPRQLFERFNIEALSTTDAATETLAHHQAIRAADWTGRIVPTFRPDGVVNLHTAGWRANIDKLSAVSGIDIVDYDTFMAALLQRRAFFKALGATATDHGAASPYTTELSQREAQTIFQRALAGRATEADAAQFTGHMLLQMARMSCEDGMVMQLHVGSYRNHNRVLFEQFGANMGADIPLSAEFTRNLRPLLDQFGNDSRLTLILFTLDEATYARELAPLAGHYPALKLGPPWWFFDSWNGMRRYFDRIVETAGIYNTVGFNDDTRAFPSIPARHDVWRRAVANWLAALVIRHFIDQEDAHAMAYDMAYRLAQQAYNL